MREIPKKINEGNTKNNIQNQLGLRRLNFASMIKLFASSVLRPTYKNINSYLNHNERFCSKLTCKYFLVVRHTFKIMDLKTF